MATTKTKRKLIIIGWDAADWQHVQPLMQQGLMPTFSKLVQQGASGNLATLDPPFSPMLWTSIATGKTGDEHGILGFVEPDPEAGGVRPINSTSRRQRAFWNIFHHVGLRSLVCGWWPSHPAEPFDGAMVSNWYQKGYRTWGQPWPLAPGSVLPKALEAELEALRLHPAELTAAHILPFIPKAGEINQEKDKRLEYFVKTLSEGVSQHAAFTHLLETQDWDVAALYLDVVDKMAHGFMKFHPPQLPGLPDELFELYKGVMTATYRFHDMMLDRQLQLAGEDATVLLLSDHGFYSDEKRPLRLPKIEAAIALEHRPYGLMVLKGPGIKAGEPIYGASLLDVCPTILTLMGQPVGRDMPGKVLTNVFEPPPEVTYIDSWQAVEGDFGEHPPHTRTDPEEAAEALQQLIELGYIDDPGPDKQKAADHAQRELDYNRSRVLRSRNRHAEATELLEDLLAQKPKDLRFLLDRFELALQTRDLPTAQDLLGRLRALENDDVPDLRLHEARLKLRTHQVGAALDLLEAIRREPGRVNASLLGKVATAYLRLFRWQDAYDTLKEALELEGEQPALLAQLAQAAYHLGHYEEAAEAALDATGLMFFQPTAHVRLGLALEAMGLHKDAANAYSVALSQVPPALRPRARLARLLAGPLEQPDAAAAHQQILDAMLKGTVYIVSGLPRSGTSLMMQMLAAGGLPTLTDGERNPDDNNPKGYYEYTPVKATAKDNSWVEQADGQAVKVILQLLKHLPRPYSYKVIFMERPLPEVLRSQQKMLGKNPDIFPETIANAFRRELDRLPAWVEEMPQVELLRVPYQEVVANPHQWAEELASFLGKGLDTEAMAEAVDPQLYRNRQPSAS